MKESEPEINEIQVPELEPIVVTDEIPIFDFEDEAKYGIEERNCVGT
jgi:hypothetical protein